MSQSSSSPSPSSARDPSPGDPSSVIAFPRFVSEMTPQMRELELKTFEIAFESALERISSGDTLDQFCREYHSRLWPGRFRAWIYRDPRRRRAFEVAEALWADCAADDLVRIADGLDPDGNPTPSDVQRSSLMIAVRKYRMAVANRKKYGEVKKVEQTSTINGTFRQETTLDLTKLSSAEIRAALAEQLSLAQGMRELSSPNHPEHPSDPSRSSVTSLLLDVDDPSDPSDPSDEEAIDG